MNTKQFRQKILDLAIHGKLVPQDPNEELAIELLKRINPNFTPCDNGHYPKLPNTWAICKLEDIVDYEQPNAYIVNSTNYNDSYTTPVLTAGKSFILGYTNESDGIYSNIPCIIFDDFTTDSKFVNFPFKVKSSAMKILKVRKGIEIEYVAMFMSITRLIGVSHKRYWISEYSKLTIPIPPQKEQCRIVSEINRWFALIDQIEKSKTNIQNYISQAKTKILNLAIHGKLVPQDPNDEPALELLKRINPNFTPCDKRHYENIPKGWAICTLDDVVNITMGQSPAGNSINTQSGIEFHQGKLNFSDKYISHSGKFTNEPVKIVEPNSILLCLRAPVGDVNITTRKICIGRGLCGIRTKECDLEFMFYLLISLYDYFNNNATGSTFKAISHNIIREAIIALPPLKEQQRIASKIDELYSRLDKILSSLEA